MATRLGETFLAELHAAGVTDIRIAYWPDRDAVLFAPDYDPAQRAAAEAVVEAHDPDALPRDVVRDAYVDAKAAIAQFNSDPSLTTARPAIVKLGKCVEELLKFLNRRIA